MGVVTSTCMTGLISECEIRAHSSAIRPAPFSDHHLVTVTVSLRAERPGPAYWHFNNSLLEDESFVTSFWEFWLAWREQWRAFPSVRRWWDLGKVRAKLFCRDYTRGTSRRRNAAIEQLEQEVLEMERRLAANPEDPSLCGACREKREELQALEDHRARGAFVRSRIRLLREMDRGSRFFYALEKTRGAKKHVTCLLAEDGTPLTDPQEMCGRARDFYTSLFSPDPTDPGACGVLWEELPTEKAFDRVDHGYLLSTLQAFGFGPQFVSFLRVLYASAECLVRLNWTLTEPVSFGQGVRQGCPLSSQLYALVIEPFLCLLCRRMTGLVLREPELRLVLSVYANDVLLVVQDPGDLARVEACQAIYSAASSARVNWVKSSGLAVGDWRQVSSLPPALQTIRWSVGPLLYLGVYLSAMHPSLPENWQNLEGGVIEQIRKWTRLLRCLSL
ncbi:unnamed protein product [Caretta caretta]